MIDHISVGVKDLEKCQHFYDRCLETLGYRRVAQSKHHAAYAEQEEDRTFFIQHPENRQPATQGNGVHVAFTAHSKEEVDAFFSAAKKMGGIDVGAPNARYYDHYYACFVLDPEGNKLEAVFIDAAGR